MVNARYCALTMSRCKRKEEEEDDDDDDNDKYCKKSCWAAKPPEMIAHL